MYRRDKIYFRIFFTNLDACSDIFLEINIHFLLMVRYKAKYLQTLQDNLFETLHGNVLATLQFNVFTT